MLTKSSLFIKLNLQSIVVTIFLAIFPYNLYASIRHNTHRVSHLNVFPFFSQESFDTLSIPKGWRLFPLFNITEKQSKSLEEELSSYDSLDQYWQLSCQYMEERKYSFSKYILNLCIKRFIFPETPQKDHHLSKLPKDIRGHIFAMIPKYMAHMLYQYYKDKPASTEKTTAMTIALKLLAIYLPKDSTCEYLMKFKGGAPIIFLYG